MVSKRAGACRSYLEAFSHESWIYSDGLTRSRIRKDRKIEKINTELGVLLSRPSSNRSSSRSCHYDQFLKCFLARGQEPQA